MTFFWAPHTNVTPQSREGFTMNLRSLLIVAAGYFAATGAQATSIFDDLPSFSEPPSASDHGIDDGADKPAPGMFAPGYDILDALDRAQGNFGIAIDILAQGLEDRADYASILHLAPKILPYQPRNVTLLRLHALALAASGALTDAEVALSTIPYGTATDDGPLPPLIDAMLLIRRGQPGQAVPLIETALTRAPNHAYAHNLLGLVHAQLGDMDAASAQFTQATQLAPGTALFWRNLGIVETRRDYPALATEALRRAIALQDDDCVALAALARIYETSLRLAEAEALIEQCLFGDHPEGRVAADLVRLQVDQHRFEAALHSITRHAADLDAPDALTAEVYLRLNRPQEALAATLSAPPSPDIALRHALALGMTGDVAGARTLLQDQRTAGGADPPAAFAEAALSVALGQPIDPQVKTIIEAAPSLLAPLAWYNALMTAASGDAQAAATIAKAADDMLPGVRFQGVPTDDWQTLATPRHRTKAALAMLWLLREYDVAARADFAALAEQADLVQARYFAALTDLRQKDRRGAVAHLTSPAAIPDGFVSAQILLGELYLSLGQLEDALAHYRKAIAQVEDGGALMKVGVLADMLDQPLIAEDALRRYIALYPDSFIGYNQLAWVLVQRETRLPEALALAQKADALQPANAGVLDNIGWIHVLMGQTERALPVLRQANQTSGNRNPDILHHLAVAEAAAGNKTDSLALAKQFLSIAPEGHSAAAKITLLIKTLEPGGF